MGQVPTAFLNATIKAKRGSGGSYLSNEIFYRVSRLRKSHNPNMSTGHYHVPRLQHGKGDPAVSVVMNTAGEFDQTTKDFSAELIQKVILQIKNSLARACS